MSYDLSYTTLPTLTSKSIGYTIDASSSLFVPSGGFNWLFLTYGKLPIGGHIINANVLYNNAPNAFVYILVDPSNGPINNTFFQITSNTAPTIQYDIPNFNQINTTVPSYYALAGQQLRNTQSPTPSISGACSLSCYVKINNNTYNNTIVLAYYSPVGNAPVTANISTTRIS